VGHGEIGGVEERVAGVEDVEVEWARGIFGSFGGAAKLRFESGEAGQERCGVERGFDFEDGVEEGGRSGRAADGIGFVDGRNGRGRGAFVEGADEIARGGEVGQAVAEIGAKGETGFHGQHHFIATAVGQAASVGLRRGAGRVREGACVR
jgi:hypothetical protein